MSSVKEAKGRGPRLDMTPMIDVVFQLMIFFVVAMKHEDILSHLTAYKPGTPPPEKVKQPELDLIKVGITSAGFTLQNRPISKATLDQRLGEYSRVSSKSMVTLTCSTDSPHGLLVQSLDLCHKHGMENVSIFSRQAQ